MRRMAINQYFCRRPAERQRANPFHVKLQRSMPAMAKGCTPTQLASIRIEPISIGQLYYNWQMKLMAIDYGEKRVGIASTDESGRFALPRIVLPNDQELLDKILDFKEKERIEKVIIGESKNFQGELNPVALEAQKLKAELERRRVEVIFHPEIFTTMEARQLQGNTPMTDASAAALILKNYIDSSG